MGWTYNEGGTIILTISGWFKWLIKFWEWDFFYFGIMVVIEGKELAVLFKYFVQFFDKFKEQVDYLVHVVKFDMMRSFVVGLYVLCIWLD